MNLPSEPLISENPELKEDLASNSLGLVNDSYLESPKQIQDSQNPLSYAGDFVDDSPPPEEGYHLPELALTFPDPALFVCFFDKDIQSGIVTLHPWQLQDLQNLGAAKPTSKEPYKYCLIGSNGSGKDKFIIAPFAVWFAFTKIRSRVIITTSSGTQLTSQTEPYIKDLCEKVNAFFGVPVFRIRQRYVKCLLTGSEIRMFATDEAGKAEGYHPMDAKSEMAIIVNEGKSVEEDIHKALRRCTGYNYWLECSSCGEPKGYFYQAATDIKLKFHVRKVTSYDSPHVSPAEIEEDKVLDGEHSAFFRSKHLSEFTSIAGNAVIPIELVNDLLQNPPKFVISGWPKRVGLDLAAGGDETVISITQGNVVLKEYWFRETDTVLAADKIADLLRAEKISPTHEHIYGDDGGVGRGILFNLEHKGWNINRVQNQWPALGNKKQFGNRGAENWYRCKRILEERCFDIRKLSEKTREQLYNRYYKQTLTGGKIFLEQKSEAKAHGRPSPDRADAFILSLTGLTVEDFLAVSGKNIKPTTEPSKPRQMFFDQQALREHYENEITFRQFDQQQQPTKPRFKSLRQLIGV